MNKRMTGNGHWQGGSRQVAIAGAVLTMLMINGSVIADPIQWTEAEGGNGHWYEVVENELSWFQASDLAAASGGYLVSIASAAENQMLCNAGLPDDAGRPYWTCGVRQGGSWSWENGDSWGYTNWDGSEPNGCCSYGGYGANYLVWRPWHNVATCGWDDTNPFHCSSDPGCTPRALIEYSADCNDDGIVDYGQIFDGTYADNDGNGVPDCCDDGEPCDSVPSDSNHVLELNNWPDAAVIPHHPSITPQDAMTIEFWIRVEGSNGDGRPITKRPGNGGCYTVGANSGAEGCAAGVDVFGDCNGASWGDIGCEWVHLAQTVDGSSGISRGYLNGELVSELDQGGPCGIGQGSWDLRFGNTNGYSTTQFVGRLDNIRIWNAPLSEDDIRHWMVTDITPEIAATLPDLGGSWNFEDGVADATGINNGWLEGGAVLVEDQSIFFDCNGNMIPDSQDIADGSSTDYNTNDVPDDCECLADLDQDGEVTVSDLLTVIAQWGNDDSGLGDINFDGTVGVLDVLYALNSWGPCP